MVASLITGFLGILIFLFIFWKRLKEDYPADSIFKTAFYILVGILIGWFISYKFYRPAFLWTDFAGGLIGLFLSNLRFKIRFYETMEAFVIAALPWISLIFLENSVIYSSLFSFFGFLAMLIIIFVSYYLDTHYREFAWYKSGKIGFAGLATLAVIFLIRAAIALTQIPVLSFVSRYEAVISGSMAFVCFILIYNLGRTKV